MKKAQNMSKQAPRSPHARTNAPPTPSKRTRVTSTPATLPKHTFFTSTRSRTPIATPSQTPMNLIRSTNDHLLTGQSLSQTLHKQEDNQYAVLTPHEAEAALTDNNWNLLLGNTEHTQSLRKLSFKVHNSVKERQKLIKFIHHHGGSIHKKTDDHFCIGTKRTGRQTVYHSDLVYSMVSLL
jgi:hypothetical protein